MEVYSTVWHLISAASVFLSGGVISIFVAKVFFIGPIRALIIYHWHTVFSMVYLWYALTYGGDAIAYFEEGGSTDFEFNFGTAGITYFTGFLVQILGFSILGGFLVFNIFGVVGLLAFDASLRAATRNKSKNLRCLANVIVFLPSASFWSSAIGKDSLSFMAALLALWAALALEKRWPLMSFAVMIMLLVRPHIAGMMVVAWTFALLMSYEISKGRRVASSVLLGGATILLISFVLQYTGIDRVNSVGLMAYVDQRQAYNMDGSGGVDIANMSLPMQMFTYMFRPIIFEVATLFDFVAAMDNLILLCLFAVGGWALLCGRRSGLNESRVFMWTYALLAWLMLAMTTANIGISLRQKWMFVPMLIFLLISVIGGERERKQGALPI
jgi:hypothetical protein